MAQPRQAAMSLLKEIQRARTRLTLNRPLDVAGVVPLARTKTRTLRRYKREQKALKKVVSALDAAAAVAEVRTCDMHEQRAKRRAERVSLRGLMTHDSAYAQLKKRGEAMAACRGAKAKTRRGRSLGKQVREASGKETGEKESPAKTAAWTSLSPAFLTFSPRATYSALERCVQTHLVGNAEAASAGYDDKGEAGKAFSASENSPQHGHPYRRGAHWDYAL